MKKIGIIGAGASGIIAAIECAKNGAAVTIFERKDRIGKKLLATGNGRCNFTNANMTKDYYYCDDDYFVENTLLRFGNRDLINYFNGLGLLTHEKNGYFYPYSDQASSVLDVLRIALNDKNIEIKTCCFITNILPQNDKYVLTSDTGDNYVFDSVIISTGGKAGIGKKEQANGYDLLHSLDLKTTKLYPSLTQIRCEGLNFKALSGVRSDAFVYLFADEELLMKQRGELLFNDSGISGIVSFQLSHCVASCLDDRKNVSIVMDLIPALSEDDLISFVKTKYLLHSDETVEEFFTGFHNKKLMIEIAKLNKLKLTSFIKDIDIDYLIECLLLMKEIVIVAKGVNDFDNAQVTGGGLPTSYLTEDFELKTYKNLFVTGELVDVDGICGGYNLQWAFSSGYLAGNKASTN